jgi:signal peptidase II
MPTPGRKRRALTDRASHARLWLTAFAGVLLDLLSKSLAWQRLGAPAEATARGESHELLAGWLRLVTSRNPGIVFGINPAENFSLGVTGGRAVTILLTLATCALIFYVFAHSRPDQKFLQVWCALVLAGAVGNLYDRLAFGYVRDFVEITKQVSLGGWTFGWPYVFNVADVYLVAGVLAIALVYLFAGDAEEAKSPRAKTRQER